MLVHDDKKYQWDSLSGINLVSGRYLGKEKGQGRWYSKSKQPLFEEEDLLSKCQAVGCLEVEVGNGHWEFEFQGRKRLWW